MLEDGTVDDGDGQLVLRVQGGRQQLVLLAACCCCCWTAEGAGVRQAWDNMQAGKSKGKEGGGHHHQRASVVARRRVLEPRRNAFVGLLGRRTNQPRLLGALFEECR